MHDLAADLSGSTLLLYQLCAIPHAQGDLICAPPMRFNKLLLVSIMVLSVVVTVLAIYVSRQNLTFTMHPALLKSGLKSEISNVSAPNCDAQCQYDQDFNGALRPDNADDNRTGVSEAQKAYERQYSGIMLSSKEVDKMFATGGAPAFLRGQYLMQKANEKRGLGLGGLTGGTGFRNTLGVPGPGTPTTTSGAALSDLDPVEVTVQVTGGSVKFKITLAPKDPNDIIVTIDISCVVGTTAGNCTAAMLAEALNKAGNVKDFFVALAGAGINVPAMLTALTAQCVNKTTCSYSTGLLAFLITPTPGGPTVNPTGGFNATPTPGTDATVPADRVSIRLRIRPQGVMTERELPYNKLKVAVSVGGGVGTTALAKTTDAVVNEFVSVGDGMFEGTATFDPKILKAGKGYKILVKAGKHLTKRFCSPEPNKGKTSPDSSYTCPQVNAGIIDLKLGLNTFDFSNVYLPAGDLAINGKQDGVVDSTDFTFIRKKIPSEDPEVLRVGDINMDGVLDTQDYVLTISNLVNNVDEL